MSWEKSIEELRRRERLAEKMGGEEPVERQRGRGKLTVRERVAFLVQRYSLLIEQCKAGNLLALELEKWNKYSDSPVPLLCQQNAEMSVLKVYRRIAEEVEKALG